MLVYWIRDLLLSSYKRMLLLSVAILNALLSGVKVLGLKALSIRCLAMMDVTMSYFEVLFWKLEVLLVFRYVDDSAY